MRSDQIAHLRMDIDYRPTNCNDNEILDHCLGLLGGQENVRSDVHLMEVNIPKFIMETV